MPNMQVGGRDLSSASNELLVWPTAGWAERAVRNQQRGSTSAFCYERIATAQPQALSPRSASSTVDALRAMKMSARCAAAAGSLPPPLPPPSREENAPSSDWRPSLKWPMVTVPSAVSRAALNLRDGCVAGRGRQRDMVGNGGGSNSALPPAVAAAAAACGAFRWHASHSSMQRCWQPIAASSSHLHVGCALVLDFVRQQQVHTFARHLAQLQQCRV